MSTIAEMKSGLRTCNKKSSVELKRIKIHAFNFLVQQFTCLLFVGFSGAQSYSYKNYSVENGLSSSIVYNAFQDSKGYIWFSTEAGASRFDGTNFKNYSAKEGLTDNIVLSTTQDSKGKIWFITLSGRLYYFEQDKIHLYDLSEIRTRKIRTIEDDPHGNYWLTTEAGELIRINAGKVRTIISKGTNTSIYKDDEGIIRGILNFKTFKIENGALDSLSTPGLKYKGEQIKPLKNGNLLIYDQKGNITLNDKTGQKISLSTKQDLGSTYQHNIIEDRDKRLWVNTNKGVWCLGQHIEKPDFTSVFLPDKPVNFTLQDREGNFWFCTNGEGVYFLPSTEIYAYTREEGLSENKVITITSDQKKNIWIGFNNGKVNLFKNGRAAKEINAVITPTASTRITCSMLHSDGSIWFGKDDGAFVIEPDGTTNSFTAENFGGIKSICEGIHGEVWLSSHCCIWKIKNREMTLIDENLGRNTAIFVNQKGLVYIGNDKGLLLYDGKKITPYPDPGGLFKQRITRIREADDGTLWFSTQGNGLIGLKGAKIIQITEDKGLCGNICSSFILDGKNKIWVASNKGLSKITFSDQDSFRIYNYSVKQGLISNEINELYKTGNKIWLATNKGLNVFDENKVRPNTLVPPVYISALRIMNRDTTIQKVYHLSYHQNSIEIDYIALSFRSAGKVKYKYRMLGIDTNWVFSTFTSVQYPDLQPGTYTFEISAMNEDAYWAAHPLVLRFVISPPFWLTWWFILISIISFIGLTVAIALIRIKRKTRVNKKISGLELDALRAQMDPHFIFNSLNSIHRYIIKSDEKNASEYLIEFAKLMRLMLNNSRQEFISLEDEIIALKLYLKLESLRFSEQFDYSITVEKEIDIWETEIPPMLIQPFIENSVKHGIVYLKNKGRILVSFKKEGEKLLCVVEDNGPGRKKSEELKADRMYGYESLGTKITEERLNILNDGRKNKINIRYEDLEDKNGYSCGTRVSLLIPLEL